MRKQVAILAGGLGTRLRPLTETCPKPMVPVCGEPFLHWQILDLKAQGYTDIVLLVAYLGEQVQEHFGDGARFGVSIEYSFEKTPMGTGGAVRNALDFLEDEFLLVNGDSFLQAPLDDLAGFFDEGRFDAVVTTHSNRPSTPVPNNLKVKNQTVIAYEKEAGADKGFECVDSGIHVVKKSLFLDPLFAGREKFQLEEVLHPLIEKRAYGAFAVDRRFYDIGKPERLVEFESFVRDELQAGRFSGQGPEGVP